jgi:hypothetical protein
MGIPFAHSSNLAWESVRYGCVPVKVALHFIYEATLQVRELTCGEIQIRIPTGRYGFFKDVR